MSEKFVTKDFCDERFKRVADMLSSIVKKLDKMVAETEKNRNKCDAEKAETWKSWRSFAFAVIGGAIVTLFSFLLRLL